MDAFSLRQTHLRSYSRSEIEAAALWRSAIEENVDDPFAPGALFYLARYAPDQARELAARVSAAPPLADYIAFWQEVYALRGKPAAELTSRIALTALLPPQSPATERQRRILLHALAETDLPRAWELAGKWFSESAFRRHELLIPLWYTDPVAAWRYAQGSDLMLDAIEDGLMILSDSLTPETVPLLVALLEDYTSGRPRPLTESCLRLVLTEAVTLPLPGRSAIARAAASVSPVRNDLPALLTLAATLPLADQDTIVLTLTRRLRGRDAEGLRQLRRTLGRGALSRDFRRVLLFLTAEKRPRLPAQFSRSLWNRFAHAERWLARLPYPQLQAELRARHQRRLGMG